MTLFWSIVAFAGGYAASIYTWPYVRYIANGAETEIERFKKAIDALRGQ